MLSLIVLCGFAPSARDKTSGDAESVVRTLSAFVGASVRGLVRDAVLAGRPKTDLSFIADQAGCAFVEAATEADALRQAISLTRANDLMLLYTGYIPESGFVEVIEELLASSRTQEHGWLLRTAPEKLAERLFPNLAPAAGLIVRRQVCDKATTASFANLVKVSRARATSRLHLRRIV